MSKGENMVERCARAIFDKWCEFQDGYAVHRMTWADAVLAANDPKKYPKMAKIVPMARAEARAVIEALMEPTEAMEKAAREYVEPYHEIPRHVMITDIPDNLFRLAFTAMLRTALSQPNDEAGN